MASFDVYCYDATIVSLIAMCAQQSVHRTAGGLRVLSLIQARNLVPFCWLILPAAGNAGRWAVAESRTRDVAKQRRFCYGSRRLVAVSCGALVVDP
jgi:hypothetical protein